MDHPFVPRCASLRGHLAIALLSALFVHLSCERALGQTPTPTRGGDCCVTHKGPGCDLPACEQCVCDGVDPACCASAWDLLCASVATQECLGPCSCASEPTPTPTLTPTPGGDCCNVHAGSGCDVGECQTCVCATDPLCCSMAWDVACVAQAAEECRPSCLCDPLPTATPTPSPTPGGDCCAMHAGPGCDVPDCQTCVCTVDTICCSMSWDAACALEAAEECAASCACSICVGDCDGDGAVRVAELVKGVNIALGNATIADCLAFDVDNDQEVKVFELIQGVNAALSGCP